MDDWLFLSIHPRWRIILDGSLSFLVAKIYFDQYRAFGGFDVCCLSLASGLQGYLNGVDFSYPVVARSSRAFFPINLLVCFFHDVLFVFLSAERMDWSWKKMRTRNFGVDILKVLSCGGVVCLHFGGNLPFVVAAVPIFMFLAAYLSGPVVFSGDWTMLRTRLIRLYCPFLAGGRFILHSTSSMSGVSIRRFCFFSSLLAFRLVLLCISFSYLPFRLA